MAVRQCLVCRELGEWGRSGRCAIHRLAHNRDRDRTPQRRAQKQKYDRQHRQLRDAWAPVVATGTVSCWRCSSIIPPGAWHLGHRDDGPQLPEHVSCNLSHSNEGRNA